LQDLIRGQTLARGPGDAFFHDQSIVTCSILIFDASDDCVAGQVDLGVGEEIDIVTNIDPLEHSGEVANGGTERRYD